ncbi:hypothetical protein GE061_011762 [Apolygus lucorum]|uniref:Guanylate-binding protein N-terminal domain-containing protein n=1 Tax=Apolygus lucorum TaxID=248454 RepID=A0A6A4K2E7_APOLU|nr:hypothetical protein GE061_011762 [Apolygus lucorum]
MDFIPSRTKKAIHYKLDKGVIEKLTDSEVANLRVAVISVVGKGSEIIFSLLLKYANHTFKEGTSSNVDWLEGWIQEKELVDQGTITISPKLFITTINNDEKIAILIVGSQSRLNFEEEAGTFAINALMSSCQIVHFNRRISEEKLKHVETFTEFARRVRSEGAYILDRVMRFKTFQEILFVVRGWDKPTQYDFGRDGGQRYLIESIFHGFKSDPDRLKTRQNLTSSFEEIKCFLMADFGLRIGLVKQRFTEESNLFMEHFRILVQTVMAPDNLILKRQGGQFMTVERLVYYIKMWLDQLNKAKPPSLNSMYHPEKLANYLVLRKKAVELYTSRMIEMGSEGPKFVEPAELMIWHREAKMMAVNYFEEHYESFDPIIETRHKKKLNRAINEKFEGIRAENFKKFKPWASLVWLPLVSSAFMTYCFFTFKHNPNDKPMSQFRSWTVFMAFWLCVSMFFRWGYLIYQQALGVFSNNIIQIVAWSIAITYGGFHIYIYLFPGKPNK